MGLDAQTKAFADYLASIMKTADAPLRSRVCEGTVVLTNRRTHVITLYGDGHGEPPYFLLPGIPKEVPDHYLEHEMISRLIEDGGIVEGSKGANKAAAALVKDVDFQDPEGSKAKGRQRAVAREKAAAAAAAGDSAPEPGAPPSGSGDGKKPWEA